MEQLANNFLDKDKNDLTPIIRGRIYAFKEVMTFLDELETYDKMKLELLALENEGFTAGPDEMTIQ